MAVDAGHSHLLEFDRNLAVHFQVGVAEVVHPHLLLQFGGIGRLAGEAGAAGLQAGGVDLQLVDEHVVMAPRLVILDPEPPAVEQQGHVREFAEFVIDHQVRIVAFLIFALGGFGVFGLEPGVVFQGIELAPIGGIIIPVGDGPGLHGLRFGGRTGARQQDNPRQTHQPDHKTRSVPLHKLSRPSSLRGPGLNRASPFVRQTAVAIPAPPVFINP